MTPVCRAALGGAAFALLVAPALAAPETLAIDGSRSQASFEVHLRLPLRARGRFERVSGTLIPAPDGAWQVRVAIDGRSLRFDGPGWMERVTRSEAFLALDRYPDIEFHSDPISDAALHGGGELRGQLSLRGQRRPVAFVLLPPGCARPGRDCDLHVRGTVSRHDFGMTAYRISVRDPVDVDIRVRLQAPSP